MKFVRSDDPIVLQTRDSARDFEREPGIGEQDDVIVLERTRAVTGTELTSNDLRSAGIT
jgi:hypothetical protein